VVTAGDAAVAAVTSVTIAVVVTAGDVVGVTAVVTTAHPCAVATATVVTAGDVAVVGGVTWGVGTTVAVTKAGPVAPGGKRSKTETSIMLRVACCSHGPGLAPARA
jgi:hypothetical protein